MENQQEETNTESPNPIPRSLYIWLASITFVLLAYLVVTLTQLQGFQKSLAAQNQKTDSLGQVIDSLANLWLEEEGTIVFTNEVEEPQEATLVEEETIEPEEETADNPSEAAPTVNTSRTAPAPRAGPSNLVGKLLDGLTLNGVLFDGYIVDPKQENIQFYHLDEGKKIETIQQLKKVVEAGGKQLAFATNGGIFKKNLNPEGLYKEDGQELFPLNLSDGPANFTNFYSIEPNGVFFLEKNGTAGVCKREDFNTYAGRAFNATQSGPMLVIDGKVNNELKPGSPNKNLRSGVGVTEAGKVVFIISKNASNFYNFASIFKYYGCQNALYLDGAISEMYLPSIGRKKTANSFSTFIAISK
ncbi:MAG: phosphodiester glycosidase family protein [Bacteroidota bacterium]